jgi:hypothetical protein
MREINVIFGCRMSIASKT